jgi:hypothetical protein
MFATIINGKPSVFIDSIEFLASFDAGEEVKNTLIKALKDFSDYIGVPVYIDATHNISNRDWVNNAIEEAGFRRKHISTFTKLGNPRVYMEHALTISLYQINYSNLTNYKSLLRR